MQVKDQCGRGALAKSLNKVLVEHIRASLPSLRARLEEALDKSNTELRAYGDAPPGQTSAARCLPVADSVLATPRSCTCREPGCLFRAAAAKWRYASRTTCSIESMHCSVCHAKHGHHSP